MTQRLKQTGNSTVILIRCGAYIHQEQDYVHAIQGFLGFLVEELAELVAGGMHARCIHKNKLSFGGGQDAELAAASGLRAGGNSGDLLTEQGIDQRRLARIGFTKNGNKAGMKISLHLWFLSSTHSP